MDGCIIYHTERVPLVLFNHMSEQSEQCGKMRQSSSNLIHFGTNLSPLCKIR